jgi:predicted CopG family antitoxin
VKGIQVCSIKGPGPLQRGVNCKNGVESFKDLILKNYEARKTEFYMKAFLHGTKAS